ncbi:hypothetical protein RCL1_006602 [Eukaryota sp. TZLM3-RCL]
MPFCTNIDVESLALLDSDSETSVNVPKNPTSFRCFCFTFNACQNHLNHTFVSPDTNDYDLFFICTQEASSVIHRSIASRFLTDNRSLVCYVQMASIALSFICSSSLLPHISCVSSHRTPDGHLNLPNKGSVSLFFCLHKIPFFISSLHLLHGEDVSQLKERCISLIRNINIFAPFCVHCPSTSYAYINRTTFLCGDFNFRVHGVVRSLANVVYNRNDLEVLLNNDQLIKIKRNQSVLIDNFVDKFSMSCYIISKFSEHLIEFLPTYKYDINSDTLDSSQKQRSPAFTDRILFRNGQNCSIKCLEYSSIHQNTSSDHKPVFGKFEILIDLQEDDVKRSELTRLYNKCTLL